MPIGAARCGGALDPVISIQAIGGPGGRAPKWQGLSYFGPQTGGVIRTNVILPRGAVLRIWVGRHGSDGTVRPTYVTVPQPGGSGALSSSDGFGGGTGGAATAGDTGSAAGGGGATVLWLDDGPYLVAPGSGGAPGGGLNDDPINNGLGPAGTGPGGTNGGNGGDAPGYGQSGAGGGAGGGLPGGTGGRAGYSSLSGAPGQAGTALVPATAYPLSVDPFNFGSYGSYGNDGALLITVDGQSWLFTASAGYQSFTVPPA